MVAAIRQVPEVVEVNVAVAVEFDRAQPEAVPPLEIAYVMAPVPLLPEVDAERACEYG